MRKRWIFLLLALACLLSACQKKAYPPAPLDPAIASVVEALEQEDLENMTLTIYYLPWNIFLRAPLTVDKLVDDSSTEVVVLGRDEMAKAVQMMKEELPSATLEPAKEPLLRQFARLYYVCEINGEKLFDVSYENTTGTTGGMFFNGEEIEYNELFYRIVEPYIPNFKYSADPGNA